MSHVSFEREHLWRCRTREMSRWGDRPHVVERDPKYFLSRDSTIESLDEVVAAPADLQTTVSVILPAEYLGRIGNHHPLLDGKLMYEEREAYMRIVHGG